MGFKLVEAVYRLDRNATTPTEQAVLLALAFRANDKTLLCYPKQDTIAEMTHLHRATVAQCLNALKARGLIDWKSGGFKKRGRYGQALSNDYRLKLSPAAPKGKTRGEGSVAHGDAALPSTATPPCRAGRHRAVGQGDTALLPTATPTEKATEMESESLSPIPNRRGGESESGFDRALRSMGIGVPPGDVTARPKPQLEESPLRMALDICGLTPGTEQYRDNYKSFTSVMLKLGMERSMEIVRTFASEMRQGEMDGVRSLPALLMSRLKQNLG